MSTRRKVEVFKESPLPDTPLIFSIQALPLSYIRISLPPTPLLSPLPLHSLPLHVCSTLYPPSFFKLPPPHPLPSCCFFCHDSLPLSLPLPPGKWHRIPLSAAMENVFIITIYLLLYCRERDNTSFAHEYLHCTRRTSACAVMEGVSK